MSSRDEKLQSTEDLPHTIRLPSMPQFPVIPDEDVPSVEKGR
jgi:hypothetical protein